jgi:hypothetical protein
MAQKHVDPVDPDPQHCKKEWHNATKPLKGIPSQAWSDQLARLPFPAFETNVRPFLYLALQDYQSYKNS